MTSSVHPSPFPLQWSRQIWRADSPTCWIRTMQKVAKYTLIPFLLIAAVELFVNTCVCLARRVVLICRRPSPPPNSPSSPIAQPPPLPAPAEPAPIEPRRESPRYSPPPPPPRYHAPIRRHLPEEPLPPISLAVPADAHPRALETGTRLRDEIAALERTRGSGWQEHATKLIRLAQFDDPEQEIVRLRGAGIFDAETEGRADRTLARYDRENAIRMKVLLGRVLEIQRVYRSTHDVFIHGQDYHWLTYTDLLKELMKTHLPDQDLHQFKPIRKPPRDTTVSIERYSQNRFVNDHNLETRDHLLSADGYFFSNGGAESAIDFLGSNRNISSPREHHFEDLIRSFYPGISSAVLREYSRRLVGMEISLVNRIGNLFAFCIPKAISPTAQYRAHPFGVPCNCHPVRNNDRILEQLQRGILNHETVCNHGVPPQFRLLTTKLRPENGVKSYLVSFGRTERRRVKDGIRAIFRELHERMTGMPPRPRSA